MTKIKDKIDVVVITSSKAGVLSSIMRIGKVFGLMLIKNKSLVFEEKHTRLILVFNGRLNTSKYEFSCELNSHPEILKVESIDLNYSNNDTETNLSKDQKITNVNFNKTKNKFRAIDSISEASKELAEQLISNSLGPVATILVDSAAQKTKHNGDFYLLLSEELEDNERNDFLEVIDGLNFRKY